MFRTVCTFLCSFLLVPPKQGEKREKKKEWDVGGGRNMHELLRQISIKLDWTAEKSWEKKTLEF